MCNEIWYNMFPVVSRGFWKQMAYNLIWAFYLDISSISLNLFGSEWWDKLKASFYSKETE